VICEGWTLTQIDADRGVWRDAFLMLAHQGQIGDGVNTAATLALIREAYPDLAKRARAVAVWAMGGAAAAEAINDEEAGES